MSDTTILKVDSLDKKFKQTHAVKGISFEVKRGQIFGILGPNGSGKTTTLAMLMGILHPTSGSFSWFENGNKDENRLKIGCLLETPNFYPFLNAYDNLNIIARIKEMKNPGKAIEDVLELVGMKERGKQNFRTYSLGMKQRLAVAASLLSDPEVLVLDEPTNGLDPMGIIDMRELILDVAKKGKTIIIASHILDEIEKICTHVAIFKDGRIISVGSMGDILSQQTSYVVDAQDRNKLIDTLKQFSQWHVMEIKDSNQIKIEPKTEMNGDEINKLLVEKGVYLSELRSHKKSLETLFIEIVS